MIMSLNPLLLCYKDVFIKYRYRDHLLQRVLILLIRIQVDGLFCSGSNGRFSCIVV